MKTNRLFPLIAAMAAIATPARAGFIGDIKSDLAGPEVQGSPKYVALYFSAHWCPPCRMFTPKLVEWYNKFKADHPDFELVFVSSDRDEAAMKEYIEGDKMPWPYVKFDKAKDEAFRKYGSDGIPYLVLVGEDGKDLTGNPGNEWQSPMEVLGKIEKIVPSSGQSSGDTAAKEAGGAATVGEAVEEFYAALQALFRGDAAPMMAAWWHDNDVTYMGPGGNYLTGWKDIAAEWELQASRKLGGEVLPEQLHAVQGEDLAMITCVEKGTNIVDGKPATVSIRSSTAFRKRDGVWKAISHQTDKLPYLESAN